MKWNHTGSTCFQIKKGPSNSVYRRKKNACNLTRGAASACRLAQVIIPLSLWTSYTKFFEMRSPLKNSFTPTVLRLICPGHTAAQDKSCTIKVTVSSSDIEPSRLTDGQYRPHPYLTKSILTYIFVKHLNIISLNKLKLKLKGS